MTVILKKIFLRNFTTYCDIRLIESLINKQLNHRGIYSFQELLGTKKDTSIHDQLTVESASNKITYRNSQE